MTDQRETGNEIRNFGNTLENNSTKLDAIIEKLDLTFNSEVSLRLRSILQQLEQLNIRNSTVLKDDYDSDEEAREGNIPHSNQILAKLIVQNSQGK